MATRKKCKKKGVMALFVVFIIVSVVLLLMFAFATPLLMTITTDLYAAGDDVLSLANLEGIDDTEIRASVNNSISTAKQATADNVSILSAFYQYSWLIIVVISSLIIYLFSRKLIETSVSAGGIR